jgi:hypothetical protein
VRPASGGTAARNRAIAQARAVAHVVLISARVKPSPSFAFLLLVAACHGTSPSSPDAAPIIDASGPDAFSCDHGYWMAHVSCVGDQAAEEWEAPASTSHTCAQHGIDHATCAQGCAVNGDLTLRGQSNAQQDLFVMGDHLASLCKETPVAKVGDACSGEGTPCFPTRAELAPDGTVAGQTYLVCGKSLRCEARPAPTVPGYLTACDAATLAQYGKSGVNGVVAAGTDHECLLAWDAAASVITSGVTIACVADSQCPTGALCDDAMTVLSPTTAKATAVCKPGPHGTLTPAMLTH